MATEENTDRFYFERCVLPEDSDSEFDYGYVPEDDGTKSVDLNPNERLEDAVKNVEEVADVVQKETVKPATNLPSVLCKPELPEDFVRNFLVTKGMQDTLDAFQEEWYKMQSMGLVRPEDGQPLDDAYSVNLCLEQELAWVNKELDYHKKLLERSKDKYARVLKERDHHKINHRRLHQEKERMILELSRMKEHLGKYEPVVAEISTKYRAAMKEKMLTRLELEKTRNQLECCAAPRYNQPRVMPLDHQPPARTPVTNFDSSYVARNDNDDGPSDGKQMFITNMTADNFNDNNNNFNEDKNINNNRNLCKYPKVVGPTSEKVAKPKKLPRIAKDPRDSKFPQDPKVNPLLSGIRMPPQFLSVYEGFKPSKLAYLHNLPITSVKVHPCKTSFATTSDDHTWKLWLFSDHSRLTTGEGHMDWVADCDFSPCGNRIATASGDTTLKIWNTNDATCLHTFMDHQKAVWSCSWHYGGDFLASSSLDSSAKIWDLNSLRCRFSLRGHKDSVNSVEFLHYSNILVTSSTDKNICLWDARMNICGDVFKGHKHSVNHCKFNMKGNMIVSCDSSGLVMTWDLRARKVVNKIDCGPSNANMVCFDPTGLLVVVATGDNLVKVVELSNEKVRNMPGHMGSVQCINYDPQGEYFISGGNDRDVIIWS